VTDKVAIQLDAHWVRVAHSPLMFVVAFFQGVAITFAPFLLYVTAKGLMFQRFEWVIVPFCFAAIFLVPLFYYRLGDAVLTELRKR
jgi:hypothetical protein